MSGYFDKPSEMVKQLIDDETQPEETRYQAILEIEKKIINDINTLIRNIEFGEDFRFRVEEITNRYRLGGPGAHSNMAWVSTEENRRLALFVAQSNTEMIERLRFLFHERVGKCYMEGRMEGRFGRITEDNIILYMKEYNEGI